MHICHRKNIHRKDIRTTPTEKAFKVNAILIGQFGDKKEQKNNIILGKDWQAQSLSYLWFNFKEVCEGP